MIRIDVAPRLADMTTLRLGGACVARIRFAATDIPELAETVARLGGRVTPLGGGSNVLAAGGERDRLLLCPVSGGEPGIVGSDRSGRTLVRVDAGMRLPRLLAWCARKGLCGLEGLAGVPGCVGGAVAGNTGACGSEMGTVLHRVELFSSRLGVLELAASEVRTGYRSFSIPLLEQKDRSEVPDWHVIIGATLILESDSPVSIKIRMKENVARKIRTQPVRMNTAGCVFRNPESDSAGRLLDRAGFRGRRIGGMAFSSLHANFLVNDGSGTPDQALELIALARQAVLRQYGVDLQPEVRIWDC